MLEFMGKDMYSIFCTLESSCKMQTMFSIQMPKSSSINQLILILMAMVLGKNKFFVGMKIYQKLRIIRHLRKKSQS
jgi:hypothetical protein